MRDQLVQRFHNDSETKVFLGNMKAAGVGINLTNASDVIYLNFPLGPAELYQSMDRLDRIGQVSCVNVHYTFCEDSIDDYIYEIIVDKEKDIVALIDQGKEVLYRENIVETLMKKIFKRETTIFGEEIEPMSLELSPNLLLTDGFDNVQEKIIKAVKVPAERLGEEKKSITPSVTILTPPDL